MNCTFWNNTVYREGGAIKCQQSYPRLINCTFVGNYAPLNGGAIQCGHSASMTLENCLIAFNSGGTAIWIAKPMGRGTYAEMSLASCNIFGNGEGDWTGNIMDQYGINGNISEDPLLCDSENGDLGLREGSPCAPFSPPNEESDLIGAWPVGCAPPDVMEEETRGQTRAVRP
jgi:predicted outer membrane repeat protein